MSDNNTHATPTVAQSLVVGAEIASLGTRLAAAEAREKRLEQYVADDAAKIAAAEARADAAEARANIHALGRETCAGALRDANLLHLADEQTVGNLERRADAAERQVAALRAELLQVSDRCSWPPPPPPAEGA